MNTRAFIVGGEEFRGESIAPWRDAAPDILVWNEYGPSEATVACCAHVAPAGEIPDGPVPIGRPISNTVLEVVDGAGRRVPCGVVGELAIGGAGLAAGYVGDDALTARLFDGDGERRYRSGDLVKRDRGGVLTYLGRADRQLKIRGHRVEPGDVESVIGRHPGVLRCVVGARELSHDDRRLVAYVVIDGNDPDTGPDTGDEILAMVRRELPAAMVPSRIHIVDDIITTTSGKADLDALAHVITPAHRRTRERTAPRSALDRALVATFQDVLNHRDGNGAGIDIRDDFFAELGGDSLLATKVVARIRDYLAVDLPLRLIFEHPTAADLADALREAHDDPQAIEHRATALVEIMALSDNEVEASLETTDAHPRLDGGPSVNGHPSPNGHGQPNGMERRES